MKTKPILLAAFILATFAASGVALVVVTHATMDSRIAENQRMAMQRKLEAILPAGQSDNDPLADTVEVHAPDLLGSATTRVYRVREDGKPVALVLEPVVPDGYAGPIKLLVSVLADGSIGGVRVLEHHETPGLGDRIDEKKSPWIFGFSGTSLHKPSLGQWKVKRDGGYFDQFTGATITPRSVVKAVKNTLIYVEQHEQELFDAPTRSTVTVTSDSTQSHPGEAS